MNKFYKKPSLVMLINFSIALVGFIVLIWSAFYLMSFPTDGFVVSSSSEVSIVDPWGPAANKLKPGDILVSIDGVPLENRNEALGAYLTLIKIGDEIDFGLERYNIESGDTEFKSVTITFSRPSWLMIILKSAPLFTVLCFWLVSFPILVFRPLGRSGYLFFYFCQSWAYLLVFANPLLHDFALIRFINPFIWWTAGAFTFLFHLKFLQMIEINKDRFRHLVETAVYIVFGIGIISQTFFWLLPNSDITQLSLIFRFVWLLLSLIVSLIALVVAYRKAKNPEVRRAVGIITVGGTLAFLPIAVFSILPHLAGGNAFLPVDISLYFLAFIPLTYGYATLRFRSIPFERYASRSSTLLITITVVIGLYIFANFIVVGLVPLQFSPIQLPQLLIILLPALAFSPLYRRIQKTIDKLFYGGWYDYSTVVGEVSSQLESLVKQDELTLTFCETIQRLMHLKSVYLFLPDDQHKIVLAAATGNQSELTQFNTFQLDVTDELVSYFQVNSFPQTLPQLNTALANRPLSKEAQELLNNFSIHLLIPIIVQADHLGIFALNAKFNGDPFTDDDLKILQVVARQAGIAFRNASLVLNLENKAEEMERYRREVTRAREEKRKSLSRDLHDTVIQPLVGLRYRIANIQSNPERIPSDVFIHDQADDLQEEINKLVHVTRSLCNDLRPPALDLGLLPSLRSLSKRFKVQYDMSVALSIQGERNIVTSEDVELCLYRCMSEALMNIHKHAAAENVCVNLILERTCIQLEIEDDGRGFTLPERLGSFMETNHFGLVGMRERIELVSGDFIVLSKPNEGTKLHISIPLTTTQRIEL